MARAGARENREREGYGRREKKGREAGSLRWAGSGIEIQKGKLSLFVTAYHPVKETNPTTNPPPLLQPTTKKSGVPGLQTSFFFPSFVYFLLCYFFPFAPPFFKYKLQSGYYQLKVTFKYLFKNLRKIPDASFLHFSENF